MVAATGIRVAGPADRAELAAMLGEFMDFLDAAEPGGWADKPNREQIWATSGLSFTNDPVCCTLFAEQTGRPIGYLAYYFGVWETSPALFVAGLFVRETWRGQGVGRQLLEHARRLATARGISHMAWFVWRQNTKALAFYEGLGAKTFDEDVLMIWPLTAPAGR
jgi:GNAT superfamily N-acetyltransferase